MFPYWNDKVPVYRSICFETVRHKVLRTRGKFNYRQASGSKLENYAREILTCEQ